MPTPGEHKTVQARILAYAQELGWAVVPREEVERRRGFDAAAQGNERAHSTSNRLSALQDRFFTLGHKLMTQMVMGVPSEGN